MVNTVYYYGAYLLAALTLSIVIVPFMHKLSFKVGAVDLGTGRRVHEGAIPRLGGIGIYFAFMAPMCFYLATVGEWDGYHKNLAAILAVSTIVFLLGAYDDIKGSRVRYKLIVEIIAALIIYAWGIRITNVNNPFGGQIMLGWLSLPITVLWIVAITNAINLIDGIDGLTAGTGILIAGTLFFIAGWTNTQLQLTFLILIGSLIGFLRYNFPPASIFMGDSGSLFVGFFFGSISVITSKAATMTTLLIPVLVFGFPLMDMFYAILRRYYRGIPFGIADKEHIHHKLLEKGMSKKKVILMLYAANSVLMLLALMFFKKHFKFDYVCILVFFAVAIAGLRMFGYLKFFPIFKEIRKNYYLNGKRKYFNHIIKRFRHTASKSTSIEELQSHLAELMKEYKFNVADIHLDVPSVENPFFYFNGEPSNNTPIVLSFPIIHKEKHLGRVTVQKEMNGEYILCTSDMVMALSEEIGRFIERNNIKPASKKDS